MAHLAQIDAKAYEELMYTMLWFLLAICVMAAAALFLLRWWQWMRQQPGRLRRNTGKTPQVDAWTEAGRRLKIDDDSNP